MTHYSQDQLNNQTDELWAEIYYYTDQIQSQIESYSADIEQAQLGELIELNRLLNEARNTIDTLTAQRLANS